MNLSNKSIYDALDYLQDHSKKNKWTKDDAREIFRYIQNDLVSWKDRYRILMLVTNDCTEHRNNMQFDSKNFMSVYAYVVDNLEEFKPYIGKGKK